MEQITKGSLEFLTVAIEVCKYLENSENSDNFISTLSKLLCLLYMKASMVEVPDVDENESSAHTVTEAQYEKIRLALENIFGANDKTLTSIHPDIENSDTLIAVSISEYLADIYQPLKDFVAGAQTGDSNLLNICIAECITQFRDYWGEQLLCVLHALHKLIYK